MHLLVSVDRSEEARTQLGRPKAVFLHKGDPAALDLGLAASSLETLLPTVKRIFHFGLESQPRVGRRRIERTNLQSMRHVLRFARDCTELPRVVGLSSLFALGQVAGEVDAEASAEDPQHRNWLEANLHAVEQLMISSDLNWTLLRPGLVIGDSKTGRIDRLGGIYRLGILASQMPKSLPLPLPSRRARVHAVAADTLAVAAARLANSTRAHQRIIVIDHPEPLPARTLVRAIAERNGLGTRGLAAGFSLATLLMPLLARRSVVARDFAYLNDAADYRCDFSAQLLNDLGVQVPPPAELMRLAIRYTAETIRGSRAQD